MLFGKIPGGRVMPTKLHANAGKPYRPSHGIDDLQFRAKFCDRCKLLERDDEEFGSYPCPILDNALLFAIDDKDYPKQWVYDDEGRPTCTAFEVKTNEPPKWLTEDYDD
jgi:hypothetical protein